MSKKSFTLSELATYTKSELIGDGSYVVQDVADLESAGSEDVSFLSNLSYTKAMLASKAGVVFVLPNTPLVEGRNFLITDEPSRAFQSTVEAFFGESIHETTGFSGIHSSAVIHETAFISEGSSIGPHAVIDKNVIIGKNTFIGAGAYVGLGTRIGDNCFIHPHVTIRERTIIGNRVTIQPGAVIGSCGFGYTTDAQGKHTKLNQVGIVIIEDDVEIGANTTIDRSRFKSTLIGQGSKLDNLVQIGHGVTLGRHNIIISQTGIAGSSKTGNHVVLAGHVAVAGHLYITHGTQVAGMSGVRKSITKAGKYAGTRDLTLDEHLRNSVYLKNIETYVKEIKNLKLRIEALESSK